MLWEAHLAVPHCLSAGSKDLRTQRLKDRGDRGHMAPWVPSSLLLFQPYPWSRRALAPPHLPSTAASVGDTHRPLGTWGAAVGRTPGCIPHPAPQTQHPGSVFAREVGVGGTWGAHGGHQGNGPWLCVPHSPRRAASSAQHPSAHSWPQPHPCHWKWRRVGGRFWAGSQAASAKGT